MLTTGYVLATLLAVGIIAIGLRFLIAPAGAAAGYGVPLAPVGPVRAFTDVKGVRDITSGLVVLPFLISGHPTALAVVLLAEAVTPLSDTVIVLRHGGPRATAFGIHFVTVVVMVVTAVLLLSGS
jgi:hypothetical protein